MNTTIQEESKPPISPERIELSGWDSSGKFFVVNARPVVLGDGELFAKLEPNVPAGAIVFVRPLDWMQKSDDVPAVYRVKAVEGRRGRGPDCVRLALLKPARPFPQFTRMRP